MSEPSRQMKPGLASLSVMQQFAEIELTETESSSHKAEPIPRMHGRAVRCADDQPTRPDRAVHKVDDQPRFYERLISQAINNPQSQTIDPVIDKKRKTFAMMREIARENRSSADHTKLFYKQTQRSELSIIFYKQAVFMKDFEDDYAEHAPFSAYYPYYQLMTHEQLRTYFTWRTNIRNGRVTGASVAYAFLYIYELLNNIGVTDPLDGLERLLNFWRDFRAYDPLIDKYLLRWIKDYHVYYELPKSFNVFIHENNIFMYYKDAYEPEQMIIDSFEMYCGISRYDIKHSVFYSDETCKLIEDCFCFVIGSLKQILSSAGISLEELLFQPIKNKPVWNPFDGALFFPWLSQSDRIVVLSDKEIYICRQNKWSCRSVINSNRQFAGYIMKQMETALRNITNYKYKLSANPEMIDNSTASKLNAKGFILDKIINDAVAEFYMESKKTVISVDKTVLEKIRREALDIQEKLIIQDDMTVDEYEPLLAVEELIEEPEQAADEWTGFKNALTQAELGALTVILQSGDIRHFSDTCGVMLEVLIDGINQKAYDFLYDNILDIDDSVTLYQDYKDKLMEMVMC